MQLNTEKPGAMSGNLARDVENLSTQFSLLLDEMGFYLEKIDRQIKAISERVTRLEEGESDG